jgi:hypothetical protein
MEFQVRPDRSPTRCARHCRPPTWLPLIPSSPVVRRGSATECDMCRRPCGRGAARCRLWRRSIPGTATARALGQRAPSSWRGLSCGGCRPRRSKRRSSIPASRGRTEQTNPSTGSSAISTCRCCGFGIASKPGSASKRGGATTTTAAHSSLGYLTPAGFKAKHLLNNAPRSVVRTDDIL